MGGLGLLVRVENSSLLTDHNEDGVRLSAGFHADLVVERSYKIMLPKPYSDCEINAETPTDASLSDLYTLIAESKYEYTQQICFQQCYQKQLVYACNCTDVLLSLYEGVSNCETDQELLCLSRVYYNKFLVENFFEKVCMPLCPLECNKTAFKLSVTTNRLVAGLSDKLIGERASLSADFVAKPSDARTATDSITSVNIFYESSSYTISTELPRMNIVDLLGSVGGNLGLFLGMSLLSVCELVELFIEMFYTK